MLEQEPKEASAHFFGASLRLKSNRLPLDAKTAAKVSSFRQVPCVRVPSQREGRQMHQLLDSGELLSFSTNPEN